MSGWIAKHTQPGSFNLCTKFGYLQSLSKDFYRKKEMSTTSIMNIDIQCMTPLEPILQIQLMLGFCVGIQKQRIQADHGVVIIHLGTIHKHALNLKFFFALNLQLFCFPIPWFYCLPSHWFKPICFLHKWSVEVFEGDKQGLYSIVLSMSYLNG